MFLMWIWPVALIFLLVYALNGSNLPNLFKPAAVSRSCPQCGSAAQNDWKVCPHCGQTLN